MKLAAGTPGGSLDSTSAQRTGNNLSLTSGHSYLCHLACVDEVTVLTQVGSTL